MSRVAIAGRLLVAVQFALIGWLIWPLTAQIWSPPALALLACAVALGAVDPRSTTAPAISTSAPNPKLRVGW